MNGLPVLWDSCENCKYLVLPVFRKNVRWKKDGSNESSLSSSRSSTTIPHPIMATLSHGTIDEIDVFLLYQANTIAFIAIARLSHV
jgi:hypothetical protein